MLQKTSQQQIARLENKSIIGVNHTCKCARTATGPQYFPLILLDEVSAHLDKARRASLYAAITDLGLQAWLTGTEREIFQEFEADAQYVNVMDVDGSSCIEQTL